MQSPDSEMKRHEREGVQWDDPAQPFNLPPSFFFWSQISVASFVCITQEVFYTHVSKLPIHALSPL